MSTLARLRGETDRIRAGRRVFMSSAPVAAYKVANNKKQLLQGDHPLVLALPEGDSSSATHLSLLQASVGPELHWTLSSINHVLRTASKYGEPTYLFSGIVDTDPQAFVAVTLSKRTPPDELEHLEGVIGRVCQFHVADSKPVQVPGPEQVIGALGKGLAKLVFGGGSSSSSSSKHKDQDRPHSSTSPYQQQQQQQAEEAPGSWLTPSEREAAERARADRERADYLSSLDQNRGGVHVAGAGAAAAGGAGSYYGRGRQEEEEGEDVPTAPKLPTGSTAMGVRSKADADARLAALKAEMRGEGPAPGLYGSSDTQQRPSAYPSLPTDSTSQRGSQPDWQADTPGTLSNPFTPGHTSEPPAAPHPLTYEDYLGRDEQWGGRGSSRHTPSPRDPHHPYTGPSAASGGDSSAAGVAYTQSGDPLTAVRARQQQEREQAGRRGGAYAEAGWGGGYQSSASRGPAADSDRGGYGGAGYRGYEEGGSAGGRGVSEREQRRLQYEQEAREAREEWDRAQREAAAAAAAAAPAGPSGHNKPRVRYHEVKYDTQPYGPSYGEDRGQPGGQGYPGYAAAAAAPGGREPEGRAEKQKQKQKQGAPDWLEVLGKVFAGGPAYQGYAPDL